jgi:hypothetical protein
MPPRPATAMLLALPGGGIGAWFHQRRLVLECGGGRGPGHRDCCARRADPSAAVRVRSAPVGTGRAGRGRGPGRHPAHDRGVPPGPARRGRPARGRLSTTQWPLRARRRAPREALPTLGLPGRGDAARASLRPGRAAAGRGARRGRPVRPATPRRPRPVRCRTRCTARRGRRRRDGALGVLEEHGFEPRAGDDGIALASCPFHVLAREHTELVCAMNLRLINGLLAALAPTGLTARLEPTPGRCCVRLDPSKNNTLDIRPPRSLLLVITSLLRPTKSARSSQVLVFRRRGRRLG